MATTALRPLSIGELLDRSFFLYRKHFLLFVGIVALPNLALLALQLTGVAFNPTGTKFTGTALLWTIFTLLLALPVTATSHGATVLAVSKVHFDENTTVAQSLSGMRGRIVGVSLILFGLGIGIGIGFVLLIVPGVLLWLMWSLAIPVAVLEDTGLNDTASRSAALTKGNRGRIFLILLLFAVLFYIVYVVALMPLVVALGIHISRHGPRAGVPLWYSIGVPIATFFSTCLAGPLLTIGTSLIYYDQKVRKEGFDLQLMMANLDAAQPIASPAPDITPSIS
jgi:hypothetical protein